MRPVEEKHSLFEFLHDSCESVMVYINTTIENYEEFSHLLCLPPWLINQKQVVLQYGYNMRIPITDLYITPISLSATLSFKGHPYFCVIPWCCVFAITTPSQKGRVWRDAAPPGSLVTPYKEPCPVIDLAQYRQRRFGGKS